MVKQFVLAAGVAVVSTASALAGGGGCGGAVCYHETVLPPVYRTVTERVQLSPTRTYDVVTPARYRTVAETVEVAPARRVWQVTRDSWGRKVGCWVDVPPRYATTYRTVMVEAPRSVPHSVYPVYGTREHTVMTAPARRAWVPVEAGYGGAPHSGGFLEAGAGVAAATIGGVGSVVGGTVGAIAGSE